MWKLDGHDVRRLRQALRRIKQARWFRRVQAVMLLAEGVRPGRAGRITGLCRKSVYNARQRYCRRRRIEDLADRPRSGRPAVAGLLSPGRIRQAYHCDPLALGYMASEWTVPLLAGHLSRQYGCPISQRTLRRRLKALDLVWKRPRHVYFRDPAKPQKKGRWSAACGR